jgi:hypothetical protein
MLAHDSQLLALLPAVGLCSCVIASEAPATAALHSPLQPAKGLIEAEPEREPLTVAEAMIRSGRESLAAGHFEAAYATLTAASQQYPEHAEVLTLDVIDAALGARYLEVARGMIAKLPQLEFHADAQALQKRRLDLRELEVGVGLGACEAQVDPEARPLRRVDDVLAAWNELRSGLPADHAIPIPTSVEQASEIVCPLGCAVGEPNFAWLEGDNERTVALVIAREDGSLSVMPDLLHIADVDSSCGDETLLGFEQHDHLVRVRAFVDQLDPVSPDDWRLVELPQYGAPPVSAASSPSYAYAYGSSGYQAPTNYYASSGYHSYGYGCGYGGGYSGYFPRHYTSCEPVAHVERDLVIDLQRGEVVLDIVRTGNHGSALGRVTMASAPAGATVDVDACGSSRSLALSYT